MIHPKPSKDCGGCKLYKKQCHCLCHKENYVNGYHEIIYLGGPSLTMVEFPGERD